MKYTQNILAVPTPFLVSVFFFQFNEIERLILNCVAAIPWGCFLFGVRFFCLRYEWIEGKKIAKAMVFLVVNSFCQTSKSITTSKGCILFMELMNMCAYMLRVCVCVFFSKNIFSAFIHTWIVRTTTTAAAAAYLSPIYFLTLCLNGAKHNNNIIIVIMNIK